jgi:hypothetical protein
VKLGGQKNDDCRYQHKYSAQGTAFIISARAQKANDVSYNEIRIIIGVPIVVTGIILITSAWLEVMRVRIPLICELLKVNEIDRPSKCERYKQLMKQDRKL